MKTIRKCADFKKQDLQHLGYRYPQEYDSHNQLARKPDAKTVKRRREIFKTERFIRFFTE